ncbi:hypothetical protein, partial [Escherichia coli]|uniref:hypothetical protein n=1 Tax=Escherichia coli TaxID=562 RepID=UPI002FC5CBD8
DIFRYFEETKPIFYPQIAIEQAGLGFIVCLLLAVLYFKTNCSPRRYSFKKISATVFSQRGLIHLSLWSVFFFIICVSNAVQPARVFSAFYLFLPATLFVGRKFQRAGFRFCKFCGACTIIGGLACCLFLTENSLGFLADALYVDQRQYDELENRIREYIPT